MAQEITIYSKKKQTKDGSRSSGGSDKMVILERVCQILIAVTFIVGCLIKMRGG